MTVKYRVTERTLQKDGVCFRSLPDPALLHVHAHPAGIGMYQMYTGKHTNTHARGGGTHPSVHTHAHTHARTHTYTRSHTHTRMRVYVHIRTSSHEDAVFCRGGGLLCKGGRFVSPMYFAMFCRTGRLVCHGCTLRCFPEVEGLCVMDVLCGVLQRLRVCRRTAAAQREG